MNFREFVQMIEAGGLWGNPGTPGFSLRPNNCDINNSVHCNNASGPAPTTGATAPPPVQKRMKKMTKK
jgi:hypothetical protein